MNCLILQLLSSIHLLQIARLKMKKTSVIFFLVAVVLLNLIQINAQSK